MAMDLGGAKGGIKSDINVTPLVDVMLVLLIIMMLVAPLLQQGVAVKLPTAANTTDKPETQDQTVVAIGRNKEYYVNAKPVTEQEMSKRVSEILENKKEKVVLIKGDEEVPYGAIMAALPLTQKGIDINLPLETKTRDTQQTEISQIMLEYTADKRIEVNHNAVALNDLERRLRDIYEQRKDKTMFIAAAPTLRYGDIIAVIDAAKGAGVEKVGIVTEGMRKAAGASTGGN